MTVALECLFFTFKLVTVHVQKIELAFYLKAREYFICQRKMNCFSRNKNAETMLTVLNMKILKPL